MGTFLNHQTEVLSYASQGAGGEATDIVRAAINNTYRRVLAATGQELAKRDFTFNVLAPSAATVTSTVAGLYVIVADSNDKFKVQIDNGVSQTVTLTAGTRTTTQIVADLNSGSSLLAASVSSADKVTLTSPTMGRLSEVNIQAVTNDCYTTIGFTAAATNGSEDKIYGLPLYAKTDLNFNDQENDRSLVVMTQTDYLNGNPGIPDVGTAERYFRVGRFGVQKQPASAGGAITVVSTSTSDITNYFLTVVGYLNGNLVREKLTMNGTTDVDSTQTFDSIERVVKSQGDGLSWSGNTTVSDSDGNELALIPVWVDSPTYQWVQFDPIPEADITYKLSSMSYRPDLVNNEDWPEIDEDFHDLLTYGACMECLPTFGKGAYAVMFRGLFDQRLKEYSSWLDPSPNLVQVFADVQSGINYTPRFPWIKGVHYGLATDG